jgi:hypothetical protein
LTCSYHFFKADFNDQSCFAGVLAYRVLPPPQFATLQSAIFPVYFAIQTALPVIVALTYPGAQFNPSSLSGVIGPENRFSVLTPLTAMFASGVANLVFIGPATTRIKMERHHQGTSLFIPLYMSIDTYPRYRDERREEEL